MTENGHAAATNIALIGAEAAKRVIDVESAPPRSAERRAERLQAIVDANPPRR
jgi:hypothetical protein